MFRGNVLPTSSGWMKRCRWKLKYWWMEAWTVWRITYMEGRRDDATSRSYLNCKRDSDIKFEMHIDSHVRNWAALLQHIMLNVWCFQICCVCVCVRVCEWQVDWQQPGRSGPCRTVLAETAGGVSRQQRTRYVTKHCKIADWTVSVPSESTHVSPFWITVLQPPYFLQAPGLLYKHMWSYKPIRELVLLVYLTSVTGRVTPYMVTTGLFSVRYVFMNTKHFLQLRNCGFNVNYNFARHPVWVWILVADIEGGK
jgi:hypothetical protein